MYVYFLFVSLLRRTITAASGELLRLGIRQADTTNVAGEGRRAAISANLVLLEHEELGVICHLIRLIRDRSRLTAEQRRRAVVTGDTRGTLYCLHIQGHANLTLGKRLLLLRLCLHVGEGRQVSQKQAGENRCKKESQDGNSSLHYCLTRRKNGFVETKFERDTYHHGA